LLVSVELLANALRDLCAVGLVLGGFRSWNGWMGLGRSVWHTVGS